MCELHSAEKYTTISQSPIVVAVLELRFLAAAMTLLRYALIGSLLSLCFDSAASTASSPARRQNDAVLEQQLLDAGTFCSEFGVDDSMLTAFCSLEVIVPLVASVDLNGCLENASGDLLFAAGGSNALRTCSKCSVRDLILTCDCATLDSSSKSSSIDLNGVRRGDGSGVFLLNSGDMACHSGG